MFSSRYLVDEYDAKRAPDTKKPTFRKFVISPGKKISRELLIPWNDVGFEIPHVNVEGFDVTDTSWSSSLGRLLHWGATAEQTSGCYISSGKIPLTYKLHGLVTVQGSHIRGHEWNRNDKTGCRFRSSSTRWTDCSHFHSDLRRCSSWSMTHKCFWSFYIRVYLLGFGRVRLPLVTNSRQLRVENGRGASKSQTPASRRRHARRQNVHRLVEPGVHVERHVTYTRVKSGHEIIQERGI